MSSKIQDKSGFFPDPEKRNMRSEVFYNKLLHTGDQKDLASELLLNQTLYQS